MAVVALFSGFIARVAPRSCHLKVNGKYALDWQETLKQEGDTWYRLNTSVHLSRPEKGRQYFMAQRDSNAHLFVRR
jgi:hypothetical protein